MLTSSSRRPAEAGSQIASIRIASRVAELGSYRVHSHGGRSGELSQCRKLLVRVLRAVDRLRTTAASPPHSKRLSGNQQRSRPRHPLCLFGMRECAAATS